MTKRGWLIGGGVLLGLFVGLLAVTAFLPEPVDQLNGSVINSRPNGTRALAQVLRRQGVAVTQTTSLADAAAAPAGSTLAVYYSRQLSEEASSLLSEAKADLVILHTGYDADLSVITGGLFDTYYWWADDGRLPDAYCEDPDALAAGKIPFADTGVFSVDGLGEVCFADDSEVGLYAVGQTPDHHVAVIAGAERLYNLGITEEGNAALALRALGKHPKLVWYLPGEDALPADGADAGEPSLWALLPGWTQAGFAVLLLAGAGAAVWRGRRFGALVREPLPVEVPAAEATLGLGRLYRQAGTRGHAAAGLRAATIQRLGPRLGLPPNAAAVLVVERLSVRTGLPQPHLSQLLYGPAPATDKELVDLAIKLTDLEKA
ncbi:MAG: DUF4350 domain-containing protein [Propionibacteriaceae bacterium]|jgi:hypothetical protein|nr:DUF4350 domain-containing protein [Propionibacteriaceae bacterium]